MSYSTSHEADSRAPEATGFPFAIAIGALFAVVGLVTLVVGVGLRDDSPLFGLGVLIFAVSVVGLVAALAKDARRRRAYLASADDPRWRGGAGVRQLAGKTCEDCHGRIVVESDARSCRKCGAPVHNDCVLRHRLAVHRRTTLKLAT